MRSRTLGGFGGAPQKPSQITFSGRFGGSGGGCRQGACRAAIAVCAAKCRIPFVGKSGTAFRGKNSTAFRKRPRIVLPSADVSQAGSGRRDSLTRFLGWHLALAG